MSFNIQSAIDTAFASADAQIADLQHQAELLLAAADKAKAELVVAQNTVSARDGEIASLKATITSLNEEIARLKARIAELEAGNPTPQPEPEPEPEPEVPAPSTMPTPAQFKALTTDAQRKAFLATTEAWYKANTGVPAGVVLTPYTGPYTITKAGTVIEGKILKQRLIVKANDVTIKHNEFNFNGGKWMIDADWVLNLRVERNTFKGNKSIDCMLTGRNATILGNDISGVHNGVTVQAAAQTVQGNYIHDLDGNPADEPHFDGISVQGGDLTLVEIKGNFILSKDTSAIFTKPEWAGAPIDRVQINGNWLLCQPGNSYASAIYTDDGPGGVANMVTVTGNVIQKGWNGAGYFDVQDRSKFSQSGNVDAVTGKAI